MTELLREPGPSAPFLAPLAQAISARRNESELAGTLGFLTSATPRAQTNVLNALVKGRKNAPRKPLVDKSARATIASLAASRVAAVRTTARAKPDLCR